MFIIKVGESSQNTELICSIVLHLVSIDQIETNYCQTNSLVVFFNSEDALIGCFTTLYSQINFTASSLKKVQLPFGEKKAEDDFQSKLRIYSKILGDLYTTLNVNSVYAMHIIRMSLERSVKSQMFNDDVLRGRPSKTLIDQVTQN